MTANDPLSPIRLQLMWDRLISVVEEQALTLVRTGFSTSRKRSVWASICWLAHSMRWLLMTTLGWPVLPLVSRYLAWVSGVMAAKACITAGVSRPASSWPKASAPAWLAAPWLNTATAPRPALASAGP